MRYRLHIFDIKKTTIRMATALTLLLLPFFLGACGGYLNGDKKKQTAIELDREKFKCLNEVPQDLKDFSAGMIQNKRIESSVECVQSALTYFSLRTEGSVKEGYTSSDMRSFFGKYFLKENVFSENLGSEFMLLKQALIGGSGQFITRQEIDQVQSMLEYFKKESVLINPHIPLILGTIKDQKYSEDEISNAIIVIRHFAHGLLEKTQLVQSNYEYSQFQSFIKEFSLFIRGQKPLAVYENLGQYIPLIEAVKNFLIGQKAVLDTREDWKDSLDSVIDLFHVGLKYRYRIRGTHLNNAVELQKMSSFVFKFIDLIEHSQQMKSRGYIPLSAIDSVIDQISLITKLPFGLSSAATKKTYRILISRFLDARHSGDLRGVDGLKLSHLVQLRKEILTWRLNQDFIDQLQYDKNGLATLAQVVPQFNQFPFIERIQMLTQDDLMQKDLFNHLQDFAYVLNKKIPLHFNKDAKFVIAENYNQIGYTWNSFTLYNLYFMMSRLLHTGYNVQFAANLKDSQLDSQSLYQWYDEFRDLGIAIKAFDPRSLNSGKRSFLEANLFTYYGNGDAFLSFYETFEYISLIFSSGLATTPVLRNIMLENNCALPMKDVFGHPWLKEDCFKLQLKKNFYKIFDNMPSMSRFITGLNNQQWDSVYQSLMNSSRNDPRTVGRIESSDIRTLVTIIHYIESLMIVYDRNHDQFLDVQEIDFAAIRFFPFFKKLKKIDDEAQIKMGFRFLLVYGRVPTDWEYVQFSAGQKWDNLFGNDLKISRFQIFKVFDGIKDMLGKVK